MIKINGNWNYLYDKQIKLLLKIGMKYFILNFIRL